MTKELIQYVIGAHWAKRIPSSIAASVRHKFENQMTTDQIKEVISKYTLRHGGEPVERKDWPCQ